LQEDERVEGSVAGHGLSWWNRFHVRITLFHGVIVFAVLTAMGVLFYEVGYRTELDGLQTRLRATVVMLSRHLDGDALARLDPAGEPGSPLVESLHRRFEDIAEQDRDIYTIYVLRRTDDPMVFRFVADYASDGSQARPGHVYDATALPRLRQGLEEITVESALYEDRWGQSLSGYAPIRLSDGTPWGLVGVDVAAARVQAMSARVLASTLALYGVAAVLLLLGAGFIGRRVRKPLASINVAASRIAEGDFEGRIESDRKDELGLIGRHFDTISQRLKERDFLRDTFGRYVSPDVARRVLEDRSAQALGGEEREATILFSDIEGYSTMNERVAPRDMIGVLNTYLSAMNEVIDAHEGCVIEFLGDAILCAFNTPNDVRAHADSALRCALAMRERLETLNAQWEVSGVAKAWQEAGLEALRVRVGIHTGTVVAGNIGSPTRMKYGVLGDVVNIAARLEQMNKRLGTTILLSEDTRAQVGDDLRARCESRGVQEVRGRAGRVQVFSV